MLEAHLAECPGCGQRIDLFDAPSDALTRSLATLPSTLDDEPEYHRLRHALLTSSWGQLPFASVDRRLADPPVGSLPQFLGNYELLSCVGRGAWGAVYRARHRTLEKTVAVKVLDSSRWPSAEYLERFVQEAKAAGQLSHANMVHATDAGEDRGFHYLVMEYIEGVDAARLLRKFGTLDIADACELVRQAAEALDFAHARGWVHRDVKPSNLMITREGVVKLLDLGIANRREESNDPLPPVQPPMGTADYMAPEQWTNFAAVDARADVYSLGCTLFKLLTGQGPRQGNGSTPRTLPLEQSVPSLATLRPDVGRRLDRFVRRMLSAQPEQRVQTAADVAEALAPWARRADLGRLVDGACDHAADGELATSTRDSAISPARRRVSRRRLLASGAAVAGAALSLPWWLGGRPSHLRRSQWRPLGPASPTILLAVEPSEKVRIETDEPGKVSVHSQDIVLVHLGRTVAGVFALQVSLRQEGSHRGAGVFFQYNWNDNEPGCEFQTIELRPHAGSSPLSSGQLLWSHCTAAMDGDLPLIRQDAWAEVNVDLAMSESGHKLNVVLGRSGFPEVTFNGLSLPQTAWALSQEARVQASLAPDRVGRQFIGRLGLLSLGGTTTFSSPQLAYL